MAYWTDQDLPFYHGLARTFPLADRWFSSCLGPTFPNRRFLLAGTANGLMDDLPFNLLDRPRAGTVMDMLTRHGISWVNYRPAGGDQSEFRRYLRYRHRRNRHHLSSLGRPLRKTSDVFKRDLQFTSAIYPLGMASYPFTASSGFRARCSSSIAPMVPRNPRALGIACLERVIGPLGCADRSVLAALVYKGVAGAIDVEVRNLSELGFDTPRTGPTTYDT